MLRKTQSSEYWHEFTFEKSDQTFLDDLLLEAETPLSSNELAQALIRHRCEAEETALRKELGKGVLYQPKAAYQVGQRVVFPALEFDLGTVVGTRPGHNPEYGDFSVIQVELESEEGIQEFASQLSQPHALNIEGGIEALLWAEDMLRPEELFELYGPGVRQKLTAHLVASDDMIFFGDLWFSKAMMAQIHVGHRNIAEAMIDIHGQPLSPEALLKEIDLPQEIPPAVRVFSLNHTLFQDERFVDVGAAGHIRWHLVRLLPPEVIYPPRRLHYSPVAYQRSLLSEEFLQLEREIDDEASDLIAPPGADRVRNLVFALTFPHRRVGTLPLTAKTRGFFPEGNTQRTQITLIDAHNSREMPGWVNHQHYYVYGLEQWYKDNQIPVGAFIQLQKTGDPSRVRIGFQPRRMRREWVRVAQIVDNALRFAVRKMPIACDYDENMLVWAEDDSEVDALWIKVEETGQPLSETVNNVFLELAKLNPQGTVHAKTLYSAVNIARRCPPAPIFAELVRNPAFVPMGDANWRFIG
ncbi:MAG: hypothetical protein ACOYZ7_08660 [Chloroflexota bacterium]